MSLTTNFNFAAYAGDLRSRKLHTNKTGLSLILLNSDDIRRLAVVEVNVPCGGERRDAPWLPRTTGGGRSGGSAEGTTDANPTSSSSSSSPAAARRAAAGDEESLHTFFDLKMGNFQAPFFRTQTCATCCAGRTQKRNASVELENERCQGHFGFISMPRRYPHLSPQLLQYFSSHAAGGAPGAQAAMFNPAERLFIMNPHLLKEIETIVRASCFFCHRFRATEFDLERYIQALRLVDLGYVAEALELLQKIPPSKHIHANRAARREDETETAAAADGEVHLDRVMVEEKVNDLTTLLEYTRRIIASRPPSALPRHGSRSAEGTKAAGGGHRRGAPPPFEHLDLYSLDVRADICKQALAELRQHPFVCSHCHATSPRFTTKNEHLFFYFQKRKIEANLALGVLTAAQVDAWAAENALHHRSHCYYTANAAREQIKQLCQHEKEAELLHRLFPHLGESAIEMPVPILLHKSLLYKVFFLDKVLVPPLAVRLSSGVMVTNGQLMPDDTTRSLSEVLQFVRNIEGYLTLQNQADLYRHEARADSDTEAVVAQVLMPKNKIAYEQNLQCLQTKVNEIYTTTLETFAKKEGLFRTNMMGKRVNQACRSVISPDYLVEPNEVLLPRPFAKALSFPEQVQPLFAPRMQFLQQCALNGPQVYPGASYLEIHTVNTGVRFLNLQLPTESRRRQVLQLFALAANPAAGTTLVLHRHVLTGDRLIFNRQPTLHKVSMMGYRAKVLSGLKTLRFHYVNGKSYNADFDGDEMNVHVPQSLAAAAEVDVLMDADSQYILPTSGKPIRGLIQDHIAAGVLLTLRDKFYTRDTFVQLLYRSIEPYLARLPGESDGTLSDQVPVPAVLRPRPLWTGKQLISAIVGFLSARAQRHNQLQLRRTDVSARGAGPLPAVTAQGVTLRRVSLIQPSVYTTTAPGAAAAAAAEPPLQTIPPGAMDDHTVRVLKGELITGVLCKNQLGPSNLSLPHVLHEIYGPRVVGDFFGALGRVLTHSLQQEGFSMGMDDMLLRLQDRRVRLLRELDNTPLAMDTTDEGVVLPAVMRLATALQNEFVPGRMLLPFPQNQLLMMTMSGAKGSNTNAIQMSVCLGQQLFDGHRVRPMRSGKTLPCFFAGEQRARAFGFAMGSFSTGIRPGEYTIHAMAGRDGLIDTAIKTARSGHLQRCLIKGMENLVLQWDQSVRDSNGSVIQFCYGGDGLDPIKCSTLLEMALMEDNFVELCKRFQVDTGVEEEEEEAVDAGDGKRPRAAAADDDDDDDAPDRPRAATQKEILNQHLEALPALVREQLDAFLAKKSQFPLFRKVAQVERWERQLAKKAAQQPAGAPTIADKLREKKAQADAYLRPLLSELLQTRRLWARAQPGDPVGLLAAQAAGEPSTQMTLNTFHSAGSTVTHVTEGIPRLRELLIYASVTKSAVVVPVQGATAGGRGRTARHCHRGRRREAGGLPRLRQQRRRPRQGLPLRGGVAAGGRRGGGAPQRRRARPATRRAARHARDDRASLLPRRC
ncbi:DNA-directed RNA polymerase I largest subunit [Strigomonas culicis]|uniref:DNA-directed RNA polymerase n=1 Tax=Strigomonas culicis TaxID=28005 RepID=S9V544_9TRYP|nr:DNA-directed RNA polymerase I largest subunit [Strigomonas culicis]EPY22031.1 DNA-directed RNA polymerase I largest subunit [Strigomonas culicis]|eukprot:EPY19880.1 DNA-directed RNA polymerase I largest subunit [Strigomonas culicis]